MASHSGFTILFYILLPVLLMLAVLSNSIYIFYVAVPLSLVIGCLCFFLKTRNAVKFIGENQPPLPGYYESQANNQTQANQNSTNQNLLLNTNMEPLTVRFSLHHRFPEPFTNPEISTRLSPHSYNQTNQNLTNMEPLTVRGIELSLNHRIPEAIGIPETSEIFPPPSYNQASQNQTNQNLTNQNLPMESLTVRRIEFALNQRIPEPFPIPETSASRLPPPSYNEAMNNDQTEEKDEPPTYSESCSNTISETDS